MLLLLQHSALLPLQAPIAVGRDGFHGFVFLVAGVINVSKLFG